MNNSEENGKDAPPAATGDDLKRDFKSRQVAMFAIACSMGTGLTISSGTALTRGGPASLLISYLVIGLAVYFIMTALGEMAAYIPMSKGFSGYASRYAHPALGIDLRLDGTTFSVTPLQYRQNLTAAGLIVHYWRPDLNVGIWITVFGAVVILLNVLHVNSFGESEFILSCIKLVIITMLILCCFIISAGGSPSGEKIGFKYWHNPGAFAQYLVGGRKGYLLGWWACMIQACFAYTGTEVVGVTFGEARNPRKTIPMAIRQTFWRILSFYVVGVWALTMAVAYDSPELVDATSRSTSAAASPFVVAISLAGIKVLPDIVNAGLLVFVLSSSASDIYCSSRSLYGLARDGQAPKILAKTLKNGVPVYSVAVASLFCLIGYMNAAKSASTVFDYFVSLATIFALLNWFSILLSYLNFRRGLKAQGISLKGTSYSAIFQPYGAYYSMFITVLCIIFSGYDAFIPHFKADRFVLRYIGIVVYVGNLFFWKLYKCARYVTPREMDLTTGFYDTVLEGVEGKNDVEEKEEKELDVSANELGFTTIGEDGRVAR
ncbi:Amino acid transporter [Aspergillus mulundensis]|uniref:Amino acid transporter n=1 Tax=Aspergillus mulundensis TaxID=1810919 RepID=A0A3D8REP9_9EURO|nr:Amino acid transporter [Aspergillus mulundensis]RDW72426.1 Amino acid transporter [Aspergillus mulundensis]